MGYADIILLFLVIISFVIIDAAIIMKKVSNRNAYREGWDDCYLAHQQFEMSYDDEAVLEIMKKAFKPYIKRRVLFQDSDIELINSAKDFREFKHIVHNICIHRKETHND